MIDTWGNITVIIIIEKSKCTTSKIKSWKFYVRRKLLIVDNSALKSILAIWYYGELLISRLCMATLSLSPTSTTYVAIHYCHNKMLLTSLLQRLTTEIDQWNLSSSTITYWCSISHNIIQCVNFDGENVDYWVGNQQKFWRYIKVKCQDKHDIPTLLINDQPLHSAVGKTNALNSHFKSVITCRQYQPWIVILSDVLI